MKKKLLLFLCAILCNLFIPYLLRGAAAIELNCDSSKVYLYSFKQSTSVFGGSNYNVEGTMELYCGERIFSKKLGTHLSVTSLHISNAVSSFKQPTCPQEKKEETSKVFDSNSSNKCIQKDAKSIEMESPKPLKEIERSFGFVQNANGKVIRMFSHKSDSHQVKDIKKAIVSQFQTKLHGTSERVVEDNTGVHKTHYAKKAEKDGSVTIKAEHDEKDTVDKESKQNAKGTEQHCESLVTLSKSGTVTKVESESSFEMKEDEEKGGVKFENSNDDNNDDNNNNNKGENFQMYLSVSGSMSIEFIGTRSPHSKHKELHEILVLTKHIIEGDMKEKDIHDDHDYSIEHLDVLNSELLESKQLDQHGTRVDTSVYSASEDIKKKVIKEHESFEKLLGKISEKSPLLAVAVEYVEYFPEEALPFVWKRFQEVKSDFKKQSMLQGLMAESQHPLGVKMLLKTMTTKPLNINLLETGLFYTTMIEKPTVALAKFVQSYNNYNDESVPEKERNFIRTNSYLFLANIASKLDDKDARPFLDVVANKMKKEVQKEEIELNIMATQNIGRNKPEEAAKNLEYILDDDESTEFAKIAAVKALRSHVNSQDDDHPSLYHADALIHRVVHSDRLSDDIKVAAIRAETYRQIENQNDHLVQEFTSLLNNPETSTDVYEAVLDYLKHVQDKERVLELLKPDDDEEFPSDDFEIEQFDDETKPLFFRKVVRGLSSAGRAISSGLNSAGSYIVDQAHKIADEARRVAEMFNVKRNAEETYQLVRAMFFPGNDRDYSQKCFPTNMHGKNICVHDPYFKDMFGKVSSGLAALRNSNHFVWEKRAGSNALHAYIGFAALAGSRIPGCNGAVHGEQPFWASMLGFSSYVKVLLFRVPALEVEFKFNRLNPSPQIDDSIYILVGTTIMRASSANSPSVVLNEASLNIGGLLNCQAQDLDFKKLSVQKELFRKEKVVTAGFIPLKFEFVVVAAFGLGIRIDICIPNYRVMAGISPYVKVSAGVFGGLTIGIIDAGISVTPSAEIRLPVVIGVERCSFAAEVGLFFTPFIFNIDLIVKSTPIRWSAKYPIYSYSMDPIGDIIYRYSPSSGVSQPEVIIGINPHQDIFKYIGNHQWVQIPGKLMQVSTGGSNNRQIWGVTMHHDVFTFHGNTWVQIPGKLKHVSVGCDGHVIGVNAQNLVFSNGGNGHWQHVGQHVKWMAVGSRNNIWGINILNNVFRYHGPHQWEHIPGVLLTQIAVSCDGSTVVGIAPDHSVWKYGGGHHWINIPGHLVSVSVTRNGDIWGVIGGGQVYRMARNTNHWVHVPGTLISIASA